MGFYDPNFWQNFWPNFWADLFVGIVIAGGISWILSKRKKILAIVTAESKIIGTNLFRLTFSIRNKGNVSFKDKEVFWHVIIKKSIHPRAVDGSSTTAEIIISKQTFFDFTGNLDIPTFPNRFTQFLAIDIEGSRINPSDFYYLLSTAYGIFPKSIKQEKDGSDIPETYGKIEFIGELKRPA